MVYTLVDRELDVLREKPVVIGGTFFEVVYVKDKLDEYKSYLLERVDQARPRWIPATVLLREIRERDGISVNI